MSQDPTIRQFEKRIANEARADEKNVDHAIKDLSSAESTHKKSIKVCQVEVSCFKHGRRVWT